MPSAFDGQSQFEWLTPFLVSRFNGFAVSGFLWLKPFLVSRFNGYAVSGFEWLTPFLGLNGYAVSMFNFVEGFAVHVSMASPFLANAVSRFLSLTSLRASPFYG